MFCVELGFESRWDIVPGCVCKICKLGPMKFLMHAIVDMIVAWVCNALLMMNLKKSE